MLDPRIYRAGLVAVVLALIVLAFSLENQPQGAHATLAPAAFNGQYAYGQMQGLANTYPERQPGSIGDSDLAQSVSNSFRKDGFATTTETFSAHTAVGTRTLENVVATRAGLTNGSIVVVAHRDAASSPGTAAMSSTAVQLELANVLSGETLDRTIVLASTSGSAGAAGATELARQLPGPVDAVIVLGDLAGTRLSQPTVVPWSNGVGIAPPMLRNTLSAALSSQASMAVTSTGLLGQFVRLAWPLTITEQGAFGKAGYPAALLSLSGERGPGPDQTVSESRISALGRTVLQTITALDSAAPVPAPTAYLLFAGKVVPWWALRLFVLVLILPVLPIAVDGLARARRRGYSVGSSFVSVLVAAVPFGLAALGVIAARAVGLLPIAPPGPVGPGAVPLDSGDVALLIGLACLLVGAFALGRWLSPRSRPAPAGVALPVVMAAVVLAIWVHNPLAALLVVPALHLWIWIVDPERQINPFAAAAMIVVGLLPMIAVAGYYMITLGFGLGSLLWTNVLMLAGGSITAIAALEWSLVLGCAACTVLAAGRARRPVPAAGPTPVTVRGPASYAGPGSLGGTDSTLRARR
jgi:hypothetical protein